MIGGLAGALIGALPGLIVWLVGLVVTNGGDGMILFGMGGIAVTLVGLIAGLAWGSKTASWPARNSTAGAVVGSAGVVLLVVGLLGVGTGPPDPVLDARDCRGIYESFGATGSQGELLDLPNLSQEKIDNAYQLVERDPTDEACLRLKEDLDARGDP